jgi:hypothetical protein
VLVVTVIALKTVLTVIEIGDELLYSKEAVVGSDPFKV